MPHKAPLDRTSNKSQNVGFIGLGAMGLGMASHLVESGLTVRGYDVAPAQIAKFTEVGGIAASSPREAATGVSILVVVVANSVQANSVLLNPEQGAYHYMQQESTIVLCATVPPSYYASLALQLVQSGRADIRVLDAPVSGGSIKARRGQLTIFTAGTDDARSSADEVICAMAEKIYPIPGDLGAASMVKMINQLLAGIHIAAAAEAMAYAARLKLNTRTVFEAVNASHSWSWMFEDRVEHMLNNDLDPKSSLDIFVKDMGIVTSTARSYGFACPLSAVAEQLYVFASSNGFGREDDAGLVRVYLPASSPSLINEHASYKESQDTSAGLTAVLQLLEGVHLATAVESLAFAQQCGLPVKYVHEIISNAAGTSRAFESFGSCIIEHNHTSSKSSQFMLQAINSLSSSCDTASTVRASTFIGSMALQVLQMAAVGFRWDDPLNNKSSTEVLEPRVYSIVPLETMLARLPLEYHIDVLPMIQQSISDPRLSVLVVLDDDPTGTQTCHGINVLTTWSVDDLAVELQSGMKGFFILTNSRALGPEDARALISEICKNLNAASKLTKVDYEVVLRGDSTLRGHFPLEVEVAASFSPYNIDGWILAPFFFQGGRYTIDDVHWVLEGTNLVPAGRTQFAEDRTFGYKSSNLRDYVVEKAGPQRAKSCISVTIDDIRVGGPEKVCQILRNVSHQSVVIVNAMVENDMHVFCAGLLLARASGKSYLYRTGATFVSSRLGIRQIAPLGPWDVDPTYAASTTGGLIIAGSYVPKTTQQLDSLRKRRGEDKLHTIGVDVQLLLSSPSAFAATCELVADEASRVLRSGKDVLIMTSRNLIKGADGQESLNIGSLVARTLVGIVDHISVRPRYLIAKGGITSSDAATKSLRIKKAAIVGQGAAGCPLWRCNEKGSRWPGIAFLVFPGNVGQVSTLGEIVEQWSSTG